MTWSIIFVKMKNFSFSCNKNGLVNQGMLWLLPINSPYNIQPIKYAQLCHMKLRSLYIWIWSRLVVLQKSSFWNENLRDLKNNFFEVPPSDFKSKYREIWASYDKVVHTLWDVYAKGCWLIVTRASLGLPIHFIAGKWNNLHLYKSDTPSYLKIASNFTTFGSLTGDVFDSENFLDHQNVSSMFSNLLYGTIALHQSHSECLKWFYSSYVAVQSQ